MNFDTLLQIAWLDIIYTFNSSEGDDEDMEDEGERSEEYDISQNLNHYLQYLKKVRKVNLIYPIMPTKWISKGSITGQYIIEIFRPEEEHMTEWWVLKNTITSLNKEEIEKSIKNFKILKTAKIAKQIYDIFLKSNKSNEDS